MCLTSKLSVKNLSPDTNEKSVLDLIEGYCVGIDMTARNGTPFPPPNPKKNIF